MREPRTRTFDCPATRLRRRRPRLVRVAAHGFGGLRGRARRPRRRFHRRRTARGASLLEEQRVLLAAHDQRALGAHVHLVVVVERIRLDRREHHRAAAGIVERRVDVVVDLAVAFRKTVDAARGDDRFRRGSEEPVRGVDLVAAELGHQSLGVLPVQPPVEQMIPVRITPLRRIVIGSRRFALAAPRAVAVPGQTDVINVAERAGLENAVVSGLIERARQPLIRNLEDLVVLPRRRAHALAARHVPRHHLLAEDVFAGVEATHRDVRVRPQRRRHDHSLEIFFLEHVLPVGVVSRCGPGIPLHYFVGSLETVRIDVAERADVCVRRIDVAEERAALAADADEADAHRTTRHGTPHRGRHAERGQGGRAGQHLEEVAAALLDLFGRQIHSDISFVGVRSRFSTRAKAARSDRTRATPELVQPCDLSGSERQQHQYRRSLNQVLVDDQVGPFGTRLRQPHRNRRQIEHGQQPQRAETPGLSKKPEHQAQSNGYERARDHEIERADPRRVAEPVKLLGERPRRCLEIRGRRPRGHRRTESPPGWLEQLRIPLVQEVPANQRAEHDEQRLLERAGDPKVGAHSVLRTEAPADFPKMSGTFDPSSGVTSARTPG